MGEVVEDTIESEEEVRYSPEVVDLILNIAWRDYEIVFENKKEIDQKAFILLTGIGVIFGLIFTRYNNFNLLLMVVGGFILLFSASFCILELNLRPYECTDNKTVFNAIIERYLENDPIEAKLAFREKLNQYTDGNITKYNELVVLMEKALPIFILGVFVLFLSFVLSFFPGT